MPAARTVSRRYRKLALAAAIPLSLFARALPARAYVYETTGSGFNYHWNDQNTATPNTIDIYYDFRNDDPTYTNYAAASPTEQALFVQALNDWTRVSGGKLVFTPSTTLPDNKILNLGVGDLAALNGTSGDVTLGLTDSSANSLGAISHSVVRLDFQQSWDFTIANGNPLYTGSLTPDFYDVALHEIGHALGLDHCDGYAGDMPANIMTSLLYGEKLGPAQDDINAICDLYGVDPAPLYNAISRTESTFIVGSPFNAVGMQYNYFYPSDPNDSSSFSIFAYYIDAGSTTITGATTIQDDSEFHQSGGIWITNGLTVGLSSASTGLFDLSAGSFTTTSATVNSGSTFHQSGGLFTASSSVTINSGGTVSLSGGTLNTPTLLNNGTLRFNPTGAITLAAPISGTGSLVHNGPGTTTLTGAYSATGPVTLSAGRLQFASTNGARHTSAVLLKFQSLAISSGATLDVTNHDLMLGNSSLTTVETEILAGWGIGTPGTAAITSSTAHAAGMFLVPFTATVGSSFDGTTVPANSVLVKYTYIGDVNLDGKVDAADFTIAQNHNGTHTPGHADFSAAWQLGDITLDGIVNALDFATMAAYFGAGTGGNSAQLQAPDPFPETPVPEPSSLLILLSAAVPLLLRANRKSKIKN